MKSLTFRKTYGLLLGLFLVSAFAKAQLSTINPAMKNLLASYVNAGQVDYSAIKLNPASLNAAVEGYKQLNLADLTPQERKAALINAYNLFTIKGVIDNHPTQSVMNERDFFDIERYNIDGKILSLNQIEKNILFVEFPDPRMHFALVCAAVSCPPLNNKPFTAENVDFMLKKLTRAAINNPDIVKLDMHEKTATVSKIFDWYAADFTASGTLIDYLNKYRDNEIPDGFTINYLEYDWNLNGK